VPSADRDPSRSAEVTRRDARQRLRIDLAYDGAPFAGFARQPDLPTVQGTLEGALSSLLGQQVDTTCAGRTDRGVHALAQVVHLDVDASVSRAARAVADPAVLRTRLDRMVGDAITIWRVRAVGPGFDARFSATARGYRYRLVDGEVVAPLHRHDRWVVTSPLALRPMRTAAAALVGEHDFASFCRRAAGRTTVRRLDEVAITRPAAGRIDVRLAGTAFCHQQVRSIVGCLVEVGRGGRDPGWVAEVLAARDRSAAARVAPPHGLTLERVAYGRGWPAAPPAGATTVG
jgi:tRNA pseudouridine38-40 synthase